MSRCGCTSPCPACPQSTYYDEAPVNNSLVVDLPTSTLVDLIIRTFNIPAALPGIGIRVIATVNVFAGAGASDFDLGIILDGAVLRSHAISLTQFLVFEVSVMGAVQQLSPGSHTVILRGQSIDGPSTAKAEMTIELIRSDNLVVN